MQARHNSLDGFSYPLALNPLGGNVGIGTSSPSARLHIKTSTQYDGLLISNGSSNIVELFGEDSGNERGVLRIKNLATTKIQLDSNGTSFINSGNVGIGTTSPINDFHVESATGLTVKNSTAGALEMIPGGSANLLKVYGTNRFSISGDSNIVNVGNGTAGNEFLTVSMTTGRVGIGTTSPSARLSVKGAGTGTGLLAQFTDSADSPKVTILDNGNVGIGTTSPQEKLDVWGTIQAHTSNNPTINIGQYNKTTNGSSTLQFHAGTPSALNGFALRYNKNTSVDRLDFIDGSGGPRVSFLNGGNVGIGTTSPAQKLSVAGTVGFSGLTGSTGSGSLCLNSNNEVVYNSGSDSCLPSLRETKHDIVTLDVTALDMVNALESVSFVYNMSDGRTRYGFIAEDVADIDAMLATYNAEGIITGIDDRSMIAVVVKAIQELWSTVTARFMAQDVKIEGLDVKNEELDVKIEGLEARIRELESLQSIEYVEPEQQEPTATSTPQSSTATTTATSTSPTPEPEAPLETPAEEIIEEFGVVELEPEIIVVEPPAEPEQEVLP